MAFGIASDGSPIDTGWYDFRPKKKTSSPKKISSGGSASSPSTTKNPTSVKRDATYDINLQVNQIKAGAVIPCQYGRHISYPDLIAQKLIEVTSSNAFNYFLFCIGQGEYDIESIKIGSSLIADIPGVTHEVIAPGQNITLYPTVLSAGVQVSAAITQAGVIDTSCAVGFTVSKLIFAIEFPEGLYKRELDGTLTAQSTTITFQYAPIDDLDVVTGAWVNAGAVAYNQASSSPIKEEHVYSVAEGRYAVKVLRSNPDTSDSRTKNAVKLSRFRAQSFSGHGNYGNLTLIAVKTTTQKEPFDLENNRLSVVSTRKLAPIAGGLVTATRSIMRAIADVMTASYSAELGVEYLDVTAMQALDAQLEARGDYFDGVFDDAAGVFDTIQTIASAGRCSAYLHDGLLKIVRAESASTYAALFTPSNIVKDTFAIQYNPPGFRAVDNLRVEYLDENTWTTKSVQCSFGGVDNEETVSFFGVINRNQAYREGITQLARELYHRTAVSFDTGMEGVLLKLGDAVIVAHDVDNFSQWGTIYKTIGADRIVLSNPVNFNAQSSGGIYISNSSGGVTYLAATPGGSPYELVLTAGIPVGLISITDEAEPSRYAFVTAVSAARIARITGISANDGGYSIECDVEDGRVHSADQNGVPAETSGNWSVTANADAAIAVAPAGESGYFLSNAQLNYIISGNTYIYTMRWEKSGYSQFNVTWFVDSPAYGSSYSVSVTVGDVSEYEKTLNPYTAIISRVQITPIHNGVMLIDKMIDSSGANAQATQDLTITNFTTA